MARTRTWLVNETIVRTAIIVVVGAIVSGLGSGSAIALDGFVPDTLGIGEDAERGFGTSFGCPHACQFAFDTGSPQFTTSESVTITGTLTTADIANQITPGTYNVLLTEGPPGLTT